MQQSCRFPWRNENLPSALLLSFIFSSFAARVYVFLHSAPPLDKKLKFMHRTLHFIDYSSDPISRMWAPSTKNAFNNLYFIAFQSTYPASHILLFSHPRLGGLAVCSIHTGLRLSLLSVTNPTAMTKVKSGEAMEENFHFPPFRPQIQKKCNFLDE